MQSLKFLILTLFAYLSMVTASMNNPALPIHPRDFSRRISNDILTARDQCHTHGDVCAELMIGNKVSQQLMEWEPGCSRVQNMDQITGINVYDCICGLWWAVDSGTCNNGGDTKVDWLLQCTGLVTRKERKWPRSPNYYGCYRPT